MVKVLNHYQDEVEVVISGAGFGGCDVRKAALLLLLMMIMMMMIVVSLSEEISDRLLINRSMVNH